MKKQNKKLFCTGLGFLVLFVLFTITVCNIDIAEVGPLGACVGCSKINSAVHNFFGVNMHLYNVTDWLSIIPLCFIAGFGLVGVFQWIKRKNIKCVDTDIILLGAFYVVVMALFVFFEIFVVNYRPILIDGVLEASYPSSTTMLVMTVIPSAIVQLDLRVKSKLLKNIIKTILILFVVFMVLARLISGVHWFTDIVGGALLSVGIVILYYSMVI